MAVPFSQAMPPSGTLFNHAYADIRKNYQGQHLPLRPACWLGRLRHVEAGLPGSV